MSEGTVKCPQCGAEVKLTESLAAPLVATVRAEYEERLRTRSAEMNHREQALHARAVELERRNIAQAENERARKQVELELQKQANDLRDRDGRLLQLTQKLKAAQE